jgi:alkanesulfonate monooxygenase SsuD/methylene tetrahydromethanopterin reductase-like flavin-dependent oxidoreductase (luciferase family)
MEFGIYFSFRTTEADRPWSRVYRDGLGQIELAEQLGFDAVWLTEHHFVDDGYSPSVLPLAAAAAVRTGTIDIGTFIALLPLYHPVRLAEDAATVDVLSNGRFILGLSAGYVRTEFDGLGVPFDDRGSRCDEALEVLLGCWSQDRFSFHGSHFDIDGVSVTPRPVQQPHPRIFYGSASLGGRRRAAWVKQHMHWYREPELLWLYVGTDDDSAWDEWGGAASYVHRRYREWTIASGGDWWGPDPRAHFIAGSPDTARRAIEHHLGGFRLRRPEDGPTTHVVLGMALPGVPDQLVRRSMQLFAREVMPAFR